MHLPGEVVFGLPKQKVSLAPAMKSHQVRKDVRGRRSAITLWAFGPPADSMVWHGGLCQNAAFRTASGRVAREWNLCRWNPCTAWPKKLQPNLKIFAEDAVPHLIAGTVPLATPRAVINDMTGIRSSIPFRPNKSPHIDYQMDPNCPNTKPHM